jgi:hypothetical protein
MKLDRLGEEWRWWHHHDSFLDCWLLEQTQWAYHLY